MSERIETGSISERDAEVLRHVVSGFSEKEIGHILGIARGSVARRIQIMRERVGITVCGTRRPLFVLAQRLGIDPIGADEIQAPGSDRAARDAGRGRATLAVPPSAKPRVREAKQGRQASATRLIPTGIPAVSSFAQD